MKSRELSYHPTDLRFDGIVGTGGIGSGKFFTLNGDHTLGREESRSGHFLPVRDYCKQHIILHYVKTLLGPHFKVMPVGKIGTDEVGKVLYEEMKGTGFVMKRIAKVPEASTLFSFCFSYPDGSGGNLTTDNSASSMVDEDYISYAESDIKSLGRRGIIMAAPEVPLASRRRLIELGNKYGLFCTASFTSGEISEVINSEILGKTDFLAINIDEAAAMSEQESDTTDPLTIVKNATMKLQSINRKIMISITAGKDGSWCWDGRKLNWFPALEANVISTAGAGDAFFAGIITALALGKDLFDAQALASIVAGLSVCSPDTINKDIDRGSLRQFMIRSEIKFSESIIKLLEE